MIRQNGQSCLHVNTAICFCHMFLMGFKSMPICLPCHHYASGYSHRFSNT